MKKILLIALICSLGMQPIFGATKNIWKDFKDDMSSAISTTSKGADVIIDRIEKGSGEAWKDLQKDSHDTEETLEEMFSGNGLDILIDDIKKEASKAEKAIQKSFKFNKTPRELSRIFKGGEKFRQAVYREILKEGKHEANQFIKEAAREIRNEIPEDIQNGVKDIIESIELDNQIKKMLSRDNSQRLLDGDRKAWERFGKDIGNYSKNVILREVSKFATDVAMGAVMASLDIAKDAALEALEDTPVVGDVLIRVEQIVEDEVEALSDDEDLAKGLSRMKGSAWKEFGTNIGEALGRDMEDIAVDALIGVVTVGVVAALAASAAASGGTASPAALTAAAILTPAIATGIREALYDNLDDRDKDRGDF